MRSPLVLPLLLLTLAACGSTPPGPTPCEPGSSRPCGCGLSRRGSETCRSDSLGYMACVCPDTDAGSMPDVASVDTPPADREIPTPDREIPTPDRAPSGEDVTEAGREVGTAVDDVAPVLDTGTPDDGPQEHDAGEEMDVAAVDAPPADRELPPEAGTDVTEAGDAPRDAAVDRPCGEGAVECVGPTTMRVCRGGAWTEVPCGRSTDGRQEVCTPSTNVCSVRPSITTSCTDNNQCGYGYFGCVAGSCVWRGAVACVDDLGCRDVFGEFSNFRCVPVMIYGQSVRACQEATYPPRACVIDAQCLTTYRCDVRSGLCVRR